MSRLLTIVIATKNRQKYAVHAVQSILSINDSRIEVVVQDNSDAETLLAMLKDYIGDNRLVYRYTPPPFSSIDNFNAAVELSTGEYICLIGDDDGINPEIIEATAWARNNDIDALVGSINANYRWEGTGAPDTLFTKMTGGTLTIADFEGKAKRSIIQDSLIKLMKNGCTNYLEFELPKLYHGIVRRKCMVDIKKITGEFIKGLSPDIYSSIALSCVVNGLVTIDYPLTIPGVCAESTSITEGQIKKHSKRLEDAPHFRDRSDYAWTVEVPRIYCVQTIWADSGFAALRDLNRFDLIEHFDRFSLYANIIAADFSLKSYVLNHILSVNKGNRFKSGIDSAKLVLALISGPFKKFLTRRVIGRLRIILGFKKLVIINDLNDIDKAMHALQAYLEKENADAVKILNKVK